MKFITFKDSGGHDVVVNVHLVEWLHTRGEFTQITFGKDHALNVMGSLDEVKKAIESAVKGSSI